MGATSYVGIFREVLADKYIILQATWEFFEKF